MSTVNIRCDFKSTNHDTLSEINGKFNFWRSDNEFLLPNVRKISCKPDRICFTKILNVQFQLLRVLKNNEPPKVKELVHQFASAERVSEYLKEVFNDINVDITFTEGRYENQGILTIENRENSVIMFEAEKSLMYCLGLLDLKDINGRKIDID